MGASVGVDVYDSGVSGGVAVGAVLEDVGGVVAEWVVPAWAVVAWVELCGGAVTVLSSVVGDPEGAEAVHGGFAAYHFLPVPGAGVDAGDGVAAAFEFVFCCPDVVSGEEGVA